MSANFPLSFSRLRLWLCVSLPLALGWSWPLPAGPSVEAFAMIFGLLAAGVIGTVALDGVKRSAVLWVAGVAALVLLRGSPVPLYSLMLVPVGVAACIGLALGATARRDDRIAQAVVWGLGIGLIVNFLSGLLQFFDVEALFYPLVPMNYSDRVYGSTRQANHFAALNVAGVALLWGLAARRVLRDWQILALLLCACFSIGVSGSRIGLLMVGLCALLAWRWRRSVSPRIAPAFIAAPLLVILLSFGASILVQSFDAKAHTNLTDRVDTKTVSLRRLHWDAALDLIRAEPLRGVGWQEFRYARFQIRPQDMNIEMVSHAHNTPLNLAAELGIPAALLILVPVVIFVARRKPWRETDPRSQAAWLVLGSLLLYSMTEYPLWYMNFILLASIAAGVILADPLPEKSSESPLQGTLRVPQVLSGGLALFALVTMVDYDRASAAFNESFLFNWGKTAEERMNAAQKSVIFGVYVDFALVQRVLVTEQNHAIAAQLADRMLHFVPDPTILNLRLMAYCAGGDLKTVAETARSYRLAHPVYFEKFRQGLPPATVAHCQL